MDVLADVLSATKIGGAVSARVRAAGSWGITFPDLPTISFHHVLEGSCWLRRPGAEPVLLSAGDVVLLPARAAHSVAGHPVGPTVPFEDVVGREQGGHGGHGGHSAVGGHAALGVQIDVPGPGPQTRIVCGGYHFDARAAHPLLTLPPLLLIRADDSRSQHLTDTLRMLAAELADPAPGSQTITDRLVDVLFVHILRQWMLGQGQGWDQGGERDGMPWLAALRDPQIAAAVALIHQDPARPWTVEALAREVGVSRATLSRRFTRLVGEPPLAYVTRWRLETAARRLRETADSVTAVANAVGYSSEFAFSRVFRRHRGVPPSQYRRLSVAAGRPSSVPQIVPDPWHTNVL